MSELLLKLFLPLVLVAQPVALVEQANLQTLQQLSILIRNAESSPCLNESLVNPANTQLCLAVESCAKEHEKDNEAANPAIEQICKALYQIPEEKEPQKKKSETKSKPSNGSVWGFGILSVTIISAMSLMGVSVLPFMSKSFYSSLLTCLIGLAVGSLCGSAMFHLIPSAFALSEVEFFPHHEYLNISLVILGGIYLFFIIERFLKIIMEHKSKKKGMNLQSYHAHQHTNNPMGSNYSIEQSSNHKSHNLAGGSAKGDTGSDNKNGCMNMTNAEVYEQAEQAMKASFGHMERPITEKRPTVDTVRNLEQKSSIATVAWMIIFGDGVHNFIDGLSIGAAFTESILTGVSISLAILFEEFPHELGDFAVLLNSGMTIRQALMYNFLSACTCYLGLIIGILLGQTEIANEYIFALAGGMFLYISLVDMVPELNEETDKAAKISFKKSLLTFLLQNVGMLTGIISLFLLAKYQDSISIG